jgi:hypothetical protein
MDLEKRFWSKVDIRDKDECWNWMACDRGDGYGGFLYKKGLLVSSHRMAWFLTYGEMPNLFVCHTCDNKLCCNPNHLFLGTQKDNMSDMISKGRGNKSHGENHVNTKLKDKDIIKIKKRLRNGEKGINIAKDYGVGRSLISMIKNERRERYLNK